MFTFVTECATVCSLTFDKLTDQSSVEQISSFVGFVLFFFCVMCILVYSKIGES